MSFPKSDIQVFGNTSSLFRYKTPAADPSQVTGQIIQDEFRGGKMVFIKGTPVSNPNNGNTLVYEEFNYLTLDRIVYKMTTVGVIYTDFKNVYNLEVDYTIVFNFVNIGVEGIVSFKYKVSLYGSLFLINKSITNQSFTSNYPTFSAAEFYQTKDTSSYSLLLRYYPFENFRLDCLIKISYRGSFDVTFYSEIVNTMIYEAESLLDSSLSKSVLSNKSTLHDRSIPSYTIRLHLSFDVYEGSNLAQCVMYGNKVYSQYLPKVKDYIIGDGCTLAAKCNVFNEKRIMERLSLYSVMKYFLFQQITSKFTLEILRLVYYNKFIALLASSCYSKYVPYFIESNLEEYFIE